MSSPPLSTLDHLRARIHILRSRLKQDARHAQSLLDDVASGDAPERSDAGELSRYVGLISADLGELRGLEAALSPGPARPDDDPRERADRLIDEIEGPSRGPDDPSVPRDPPGRITPRARPLTGTWSK